MRTRKIREEKINDYYEGLKKLKIILDHGHLKDSLTKFLKKNKMDGYAKEIMVKGGIIVNVGGKYRWNTLEPTRHMAVEVIRGVNLKYWHFKKKSLERKTAKEQEKQTSFVNAEQLEQLSLKAIREKKEHQLASTTTYSNPEKPLNIDKWIQKTTPVKPTPKKEESTSSDVRRVINIVKQPVVVTKVKIYWWGLWKVRTEYTYKWN